MGVKGIRIEDTIAAISTPIGEGGISIIRLSGPDAVDIAGKVFVAKNPNWSRAESHRLHYGFVVDDCGNVVDEVLLSCMRAPRTYTKEDVVEINCHGGFTLAKKILELVIKHGARLAEPGEFTKRAFLNGRIDLAQAESVIDLIRAKTDKSLRMAAAQLTGVLSRKVGELQDGILGALAWIEANIDFPEEDIEETTAAQLIKSIEGFIEETEKLLKGYVAGKIYREGVSTVIAGRPNVGKSSLLNALLREERAIVTDVPGTTRDVIEEVVNIKGIPLRIIDTAGLREAKDVVEKIGVERARSVIERADLVLAVIDVNAGITEEDRKILGLLGEKKAIIVFNKIDAGVKVEKSSVEEIAGKRPAVWISAKTGEGLTELEECIEKTVLGESLSAADDEVLVARLRHKAALEKAAEHLKEAHATVSTGLPVDITAIDLRAAWEALGEITGSTVSEDVLDRIFADFCIGK